MQFCRQWRAASSPAATRPPQKCISSLGYRPRRGRHLRQASAPVRRAHRQRQHPAVLDVRDRRRQRHEIEVDASGDQLVQSLGRAAERNVLGGDASRPAAAARPPSAMPSPRPPDAKFNVPRLALAAAISSATVFQPFRWRPPPARLAGCRTSATGRIIHRDRRQALVQARAEASNEVNRTGWCSRRDRPWRPTPSRSCRRRRCGSRSQSRWPSCLGQFARTPPARRFGGVAGAHRADRRHGAARPLIGVRRRTRPEAERHRRLRLGNPRHVVIASLLGVSKPDGLVA